MYTYIYERLESDSRRAQSKAPKAAYGGPGMRANSGLLVMETAADVGEWVREVLASSTQVLTLLALLVQKCKYCHMRVRCWWQGDAPMHALPQVRQGTQFTCFTSTKVQILTLRAVARRACE